MSIGSAGNIPAERSKTMSVLRPRNRLVNFRLSEDEFESLKTACENSGARSVSDFARSSVLSQIENTKQALSFPQSRVTNLDQKVSDLEGRVGQLLNLLNVTGFTSGVEPSVREQAELVQKVEPIHG
jgi:uncharacterized protein (DUF1778 family)